MACDQIFQMIEQSKWDELSKVLQSNPDSLVADAKAGQGEDLPLHKIFATTMVTAAPSELILSILQLNPIAAKHKGLGNNTPLHLAVTHWAPSLLSTPQQQQEQSDVVSSTIEALIRVHPEALEEVNDDKLTPRDIALRGNSGSDLLQLLERPTACWHQLIEDEVREAQHVTRLRTIHERVDAALDRMVMSEQNMNGLFGRLEHVEERMTVLESIKYESAMAKSFQVLQESVRESMDATKNRLATVEDDIKAAGVREFMAKAASRAHQSDVMRMQKKTGETAKQLLQQIEVVHSELVEAEQKKSSLSKNIIRSPRAKE